jgi:hypothetical protein
MPIQYNGTTDEHGSPFLEANERVAQQWSSFAERNSTDVKGTFNTYHIDAHLAFKLSSGTWSISGHRTQSTTGGGIPMDSLVNEETHFHGHLHEPPRTELRVFPKGILSHMQKLQGKPIHPSGISTDLVVLTSDLAVFQHALHDHAHQLARLGLRYLKVDPTNGVEAKFNKLMVDELALSCCLDVLIELAIPDHAQAQ